MSVSKMQIINDPPKVGTQQASLSLYSSNFLDTGILVEIDLPLNINKFRTGYGDDIPFIFGINVTDRLTHDFDSPNSKFVFTNPENPSIGYGVRISSKLLPQINVFKSLIFRGWKGSISTLIVISTSSIIQGSLSVLPFLSNLCGSINHVPRLSDDEATGNILANLATDRMILITSEYNQLTKWVNESHWNVARSSANNGLIANTLRDLIFVRPNSNISTSTGDPGLLQFRVFTAFGPDFEWLFPTAPLNPTKINWSRSVVNIKEPFLEKFRILIGRVSMDPNTAVPIFNVTTLNEFVLELREWPETGGPPETIDLNVNDNQYHFALATNVQGIKSWSSISQVSIAYDGSTFVVTFLSFGAVVSAISHHLTAESHFGEVIATWYAKQTPEVPPYFNT